MIVRAWFQSRVVDAREVPPLIVLPRGSGRVEPAVGSRMAPAPYRATPTFRPTNLPSFGESVVFDDGRLAVRDMDGGSEPSETIRFRRPGEEPVQILPGRLEVLSGESKHREIRFVRSPGEPAELILGREPGRSPQTIALQSDTVSRRHARFAYSNGRWAVANLSRTNPVVVNDERLADNSIERPLADGDRVELGEVVLRFRSR